MCSDCFLPLHGINASNLWEPMQKYRQTCELVHIPVSTSRTWNTNQLSFNYQWICCMAAACMVPTFRVRAKNFSTDWIRCSETSLAISVNYCGCIRVTYLLPVTIQREVKNWTKWKLNAEQRTIWILQNRSMNLSCTYTSVTSDCCNFSIAHKSFSQRNRLHTGAEYDFIARSNQCETASMISMTGYRQLCTIALGIECTDNKDYILGIVIPARHTKYRTQDIMNVHDCATASSSTNPSCHRSLVRKLTGPSNCTITDALFII